MTAGITIVGLGPGAVEYWTVAALRTLESADEVWVRTRRFPAVAHLPATTRVESFDSVYEHEASFEDVYQTIAERVIELGQRPQGVVYAVPGHPSIGEATVLHIRRLADEAGVAVRIVPGLSFIEPTLTLLGLDPFLGGLQIADASEIATRYAPRLDVDMPALLGQLYSRALASDVKLTLLNAYPAEHEVTLVQAAGTTGERVWRVALHALDHETQIDDLTSLLVPAVAQVGSVATLQDVMAHLLSPEGCPWDREQTHQSLRKYLLEETYEVLAALDAEDPKELCKELGDLLLQVVFHAQIAVESGEFSLADVVNGIVSKLIRRHPHVFGDTRVQDSEEVTRNWERLKAAERAESGQQTADPFAGIALALPGLSRAQELQRRATRFGFKWPNRAAAWAKFEEELAEWQAAETEADRARELGDALYALANVAQWDGVDAESALREASDRFTRRFTQLLREYEAKGEDPREAAASELLARWRAIR